MIQTITPNPDIPCKPGWCLAYVNEAYGVPKRYGSATAAWNNSPTQHRDYDFPPGVWVPVWFSLPNEPNGHVALLSPDGSVYSTSDLTNTPHQHPDLADLFRYYAYYGMPLTYRGWTEDVEGTPVVTPAGLTYQSTIIQEDEMSAADVVAIKADIATVHGSVLEGTRAVKADIATVHNTIIFDVGSQLGALRSIVDQLADGQGVTIDYARVQAAAEAGATAALERGTVKVDVRVEGSSVG